MRLDKKIRGFTPYLHEKGKKGVEGGNKEAQPHARRSYQSCPSDEGRDRWRGVGKGKTGQRSAGTGHSRTRNIHLFTTNGEAVQPMDNSFGKRTKIRGKLKKTSRRRERATSNGHLDPSLGESSALRGSLSAAKRSSDVRKTRREKAERDQRRNMNF